MEYECGPLILESLDKICMMDFFVDVFEFEVDVENDVVESRGLQFKLIELEEGARKPQRNSGITFAFKLKSDQDLKEILSKYNFFLYRKMNGPSGPESFFLKEDLENKKLSITDIDGRVWQFQTEELQ